MSKKLVYAFTELAKHPEKFLRSNKGEEFEERIIDCLKKNGFDRRVKEHDSVLDAYLKEIKPHILDKLSNELLFNKLGNDNPYYKDIIIHQPYGSQNYPDILVLSDYILPIEDKFSKDKSPHPMWNGNLPKECGIYIFGQYANQRLTFFLGRDVLTQADRTELVELSQMLKEISKNEPTENGFALYFRQTYEQKGTFNYFDDNQSNREKNVLDYIKEL